MSRGEIDPQLPFIQVHRSLWTKATMAAHRLTMAPTHVVGCLALFWMELGDRRRLQRALLMDDPRILVGEAELRTFLLNAFGRDVPLDVLESCQLLEREPDGRWRVRGMSRYLDMEETRLKQKWGKEWPEKLAQSLASGRVTGEHPLPTPEVNPTSTPVEPRLTPTSTPPQPRLTPPQPGLNPASTPQRREVKGERKEERGERKETPAGGDSLRDSFEAIHLEERRSEMRWHIPTSDNLLREVLDLAKGDWGEAERVFRKALRTDYPKCLDLATLVRHWPVYAGSDPPKESGPKDVRKAPVRAEDVDRSSFAKPGPVDF